MADALPGAEGLSAGPAPFDLALLGRWANEFFRNGPGTAVSAPEPAAGGLSVPANPLPPGLPGGPLPQATTMPVAGIAPTLPGLNLVPTGPDQAAARLRPSPAQAPHAVAGNGVPDVLATGLPGLDGRLGGSALAVPPLNTPPRAASPSGYYFLDSLQAPTEPGSVEPPRLDALIPPQVEPPSAPAAPVKAPATPDFGSSLYVLDLGRHPGPHGHHAGARPDKPDQQAARIPFDVNAIRRDFPILSERVNGKQLVWFDNAATTQKPRAVIDRLSHFYEHENSNIHRAAHTLAARATDAYEGARDTVARFLNAASSEDVVFVRGATEGINLVAKSWGEAHIGEGDEILVSHLEHHANIVPWQQLAQRKGARLQVIPVDDSGQVILSEAQRLIGPRTKLLAVTQVSNALGTVVPVAELIGMAQRQGVTTLVDGAQSVSHLAVDLQALGCDFFVFSGHKIFGPTGIGAVVARREAWERTPRGRAAAT